MTRGVGLNELFFLVKAIPWTLLLSAGAMLGGGILGLIVAIMRVAPSRLLRWLSTGYIELFQGTPVLMQLFVVYYGLAVLLNLQVDPWPAVLLAFTLYSGAFLGEIWRGSIEAIPLPQWEAAACLSLTLTMGYKARAGEIREFTGIDAPYEAPEDPEIVVHTDKQTVDESVATILEQLLPRLRDYGND